MEYESLQNWLILGVNVGIQIPYMEHMGMEKIKKTYYWD
jgi:hypothetical protein